MTNEQIPIVIIGFDDRILEGPHKNAGDLPGPMPEALILFVTDDTVKEDVRSIGDMPPGFAELVLEVSMTFEKDLSRAASMGGGPALELISVDHIHIEESGAGGVSPVRSVCTPRIPVNGTFSQHPRTHQQTTSSQVQNWQRRVPRPMRPRRRE